MILWSDVEKARKRLRLRRLMMDELDRDAKLIGIDPKVWKQFRETYEQPYLPGFLKAEAEAREADIPQEAKEDFNNRLSLRWIKYNQLAKTKEAQLPLCRQYKMLTQMHRTDKQRS